MPSQPVLLWMLPSNRVHDHRSHVPHWVPDSCYLDALGHHWSRWQRVPPRTVHRHCADRRLLLPAVRCQDGAHHPRAGVRDQHLRAGRAEDHRPDLGDRAGRVRPAVHPHRHCVHRV